MSLRLIQMVRHGYINSLYRKAARFLCTGQWKRSPLWLSEIWSKSLEREVKKLKQELKKNTQRNEQCACFYQVYGYETCGCMTYCMTNEWIPRVAKARELTMCDDTK